MIKNVVHFFPTFSQFFVMAADYQFWKVPARSRTWSVHTKSLLIVFWNVWMILVEWVIILEFDKRLFLACFEDYVCMPCCRNDNNVPIYKGLQKFNSFRRYFNQIYWDKLLNKLIITAKKVTFIDSCNFSKWTRLF